MQWDASAHAGFTTGEPWMPVNPNHTGINAEAQWADPGSVLHHYRRLIELRHTEPAVVQRADRRYEIRIGSSHPSAGRS